MYFRIQQYHKKSYFENVLLNDTICIILFDKLIKMIIQRRMTNLNGQNIANNNQEHFLEYFKEKLNYSTKKNRSHKNMHSEL